jgi:hypothetical protein
VSGTPETAAQRSEEYDVKARFWGIPFLSLALLLPALGAGLWSCATVEEEPEALPEPLVYDFPISKEIVGIYLDESFLMDLRIQKSPMMASKEKEVLLLMVHQEGIDGVKDFRTRYTVDQETYQSFDLRFLAEEVLVNESGTRLQRISLSEIKDYDPLYQIILAQTVINELFSKQEYHSAADDYLVISGPNVVINDTRYALNLDNSSNQSGFDILSAGDQQLGLMIAGYKIYIYDLSGRDLSQPIQDPP